MLTYDTMSICNIFLFLLGQSYIILELLNYLQELRSDDEEFNVVKMCAEMQLVLVPPDIAADR